MNNHSMHVTAIIMCGGRGTRMGKSTEEKPLQKLKGRMLIEYVADALVGSNIFERIIGVTSSNTPNTNSFLRHHLYYKAGLIEVFKTRSDGYPTDLSKVVQTLKPRHVFVVPADLPLLRSKIVRKIVFNAIRLNHPCVSIVLEKSFVENMGMKPSVVVPIGTKKYCHSGITVIDSCKFAPNSYVNEVYIPMNEKQLAVNINSRNELRAAEKLF
jgi:GTP:adenosylcobinamide-phosphate guanylyltransferase